jgi:hypothetical protein
MTRSSGALSACLAVTLALLVAGAGASAHPASLVQETTTTQEPGGTTSVPETTESTTTSSTPETSATTEQPTSTSSSSTTESSTTTEPEPGSDEGDGDDVDWAPIALIAGAAVLVLAIIWLIAAAARRRARAARVRRRHLGDLVSRAEWIHDEASLEVMAATASPERLQTAWMDTHRRLNDLSAEATALAARDDYRDEADDLRRLSHALGRLAGALDTHVSLHVQDLTDPAVSGALGASTETVTLRRDELRAAIAPLASRV